MKNLQKVKVSSIEKNENPQFVKTSLIKAKREDGREIFWEMINSHDSVHILVDNIETKCLMFVEQVRIPALVNNPESDGVCLEMCAGLVDKDCNIAQIAKEEILEEMGYDVLVNQVIPMRTYLSSVGTQATNVHCFTACVEESQKVSDGGGLESEDIRVVSIPYAEIMDLVNGFGKYENTFTDSTTLYLATMWLLEKQ